MMKNYLMKKEGSKYRLIDQERNEYGLVDQNTIIDGYSILDFDSSADRSSIKNHSSVINCHLIECNIDNSKIQNIDVTGFTIKHCSIDCYDDLFTWFDKDHIIFKLKGRYINLDTYGYIKFLDKFDVFENVLPGTYIARYKGEDFHIVWNCNNDIPMDQSYGDVFR